MRAIRRLKTILTGAGILALAVGVIVVAIVSVEVFGHQTVVRSSRFATPGPTPTPSSRGVIQPTCDAPGKPACPTPDPGWVSLTSNAPSAVLAAMKQTWIFNIDLNDGGDHINDLSHLGTPLLVRGLSPVGHTNPDFYALAIKDANGLVTDIGVFELNDDHTALRFAAISSVTPRHSVPQQTSAAAVVAVSNQRHVSLRPAASPYLIYISSINASDLETGTIVWHAGGLGAMDPLWLVPGADGQNYLYGNDGKVYAEREIPMSA
jgi:hypothetical protein